MSKHDELTPDEIIFNFESTSFFTPRSHHDFCFSPVWMHISTSVRLYSSSLIMFVKEIIGEIPPAFLRD